MGHNHNHNYGSGKRKTILKSCPLMSRPHDCQPYVHEKEVKREPFLNENLFLLEFMIDDIFLHPGAIKSELDYAIGQLNLSVNFLNNPTIFVNEPNISSKCIRPDSKLKNGFSCLFSLKPEKYKALSKKFDLKIRIEKKFFYHLNPDKVKIGKTKVPLNDLFRRVLDKMEKFPKDSTVSCTMSQVFPIVPSDLIKKCCLGDLSLYVRLTHIGKMLVSDFVTDSQDESVPYQDKYGRNLYSYKNSWEDYVTNTRQNPRYPSVYPNYNTSNVPPYGYASNPHRPSHALKSPFTPVYCAQNSSVYNIYANRQQNAKFENRGQSPPSLYNTNY